MLGRLKEVWANATRRKNSLYLVGDGDDDDLIDAIDKHFGVLIRSSKVLPLITVGDLSDEIAEQLRTKPNREIDTQGLWNELCRIVVRETGCTAQIDRATTFISSDAK
ncbi:hypothetical protein [Mesorhizobium sp. IMUNJ 23232]|uniref:hypothetical protein n=1 Tax=Mesorhizobium sp. IMUNJ 23232 TaxID=3376064 RepID=UPI0037A52BB2